jgi:hypothetical protein
MDIDRTSCAPRRRRLTAATIAVAAVGAAVFAGCQGDENAAVRPEPTAIEAPTTTSAATPTTTAGETSTTDDTTAATTDAPTLSAPCGSTAEPPSTYEHVVMLVNENRTWTGGRSPAVGMGFSGGDMPFLEGLATDCTYFVDWAEMDAEENSLNQYIGLTSGVKSRTISDDCPPSDTCRSTDDNIFRQVRESGGTARTYVDGATEPCSAGDNRVKHIPALYYQGGDDPSHCADEVRPMSEFDPDALPTFAFVVPDLCHDGHDCGDDVVDEWARATLQPVLDSASYRRGETLVVVIYDEDQPVPNLLVAPTAHQGPIDQLVGSHASLLKTVELALGLPVLDQGQLPDSPSLRPVANI